MASNRANFRNAQATQAAALAPVEQPAPRKSLLKPAAKAPAKPATKRRR